MAMGVSQSDNAAGPEFFPTFGSIAETLAFLSGASGSSQASLVIFQPGGVAGNGVYTTWATAYAALNARPSTYRVLSVDTTLGAATIDANADLLGVWVIGTRPATILAIANGVTLTRVPSVVWDVWLRSLSASPVHSTAVSQTNLQLRGNAQIWANGGILSSWFVVNAGHTLTIFADGVSGVFTTAPAQAINLSGAGSFCNLFLWGDAQILSANALVGIGGWSARLRGTFTGVELPQGSSGTQQWDSSVTKVLSFAGTSPGGLGTTPEHFRLGGLDTAPTLAAANVGNQMGDVRRYMRILLQVGANTMTTPTTVELFAGGVTTGITVVVGAGLLGTFASIRRNVPAGTLGTQHGVELIATNTAGGVGNIFRCLATVEWM